MPSFTKIYVIDKTLDASNRIQIDSQLNVRNAKTIYASVYSNLLLESAAHTGTMKITAKFIPCEIDVYAGPVIGAAWASPSSVYEPPKPINLSGPIDLFFEAYNDGGNQEDVSGFLTLTLKIEYE